MKNLEIFLKKVKRFRIVQIITARKKRSGGERLMVIRLSRILILKMQIKNLGTVA